MKALAIDHVNLGFSQDRLDEVIDFYVDKLGFESPFDDPYAAVEDNPGLFSIELGPEARLFVNPTEDFEAGTHNFRHTALQIPLTPEDLREHLDAEGIEIQSEAQRHRKTVGEYTSYYVADPFGYTIELMAVGERA